MTSRELTRIHPPKGWWAPILWTSALFVVMPALSLLFIPPVTSRLLDEANADYFNGLYAFVVILVGALAVNAFVNKRSVAALGFHRRGWLKQYVVGVAIAAALLLLIVGSLTLMGFYTFTWSSTFSAPIIIAALIGFMIQGMTEEVLCRGYLQTGVYAATSNMWLAIGIQAVVFSLLHGMNPGMTVLAGVNLFLVALVFGLLYWLTDSMWLVGGMHFFWNFALGPLAGIEVSGQSSPSSILDGVAQGSDVMTGGAFGPEASVVASIVFAVLCVWLTLRIRKNETQEANES